MSDSEPKEEIIQESAKPLDETATMPEPSGDKEVPPAEPDNEKEENGGQKRQKMLLIAAGIVIIIALVAIGAYVLSFRPVATNGDTVFVYYNESFENGTIISTNMNTTDPLVFTLGNSSYITGFQDAIIGMSENEVKIVDIPYTKAYGAYDPGLVQTINRTGPIANNTFIPGHYYTVFYKPANSYSLVKVLNVTPTTITWDANNPLVGYNLTFTINLVNILKPS